MHNIQRKRFTESVSRHVATNICHAFDFAKHIRRPLNLYVVINFDMENSSKLPSERFQEIRHKYRDWQNRALKKRYGQAIKPIYAYSFECPVTQAHVNWALHVPEPLQDEFLRKLPVWLTKIQGAARPFDIAVETVDPHTDKSLAKYIIKGIDKHYIEYFHLEEYAEPQGRIYGRRASTSPAIGRKARKIAGFIPKRDRHKWKSEGNYVVPSSAHAS